MNLPIEIKQVLVCDDIRREDNGKALLIGVYVGDILVKEFPATLRLSFWVQGLIEKPGELEFKISLEHVDGARDENRPSLIGRTSLTGDDRKEEVVMVTGVPVKMKGPSVLVLSVKDGDDWIELVRKRILPHPSEVAANEPPQPS